MPYFLGILLILLAGSSNVQAAFEWESTGPRSTAMGGAGVGLSGDGWAILRNPALASKSPSSAGLSWMQLYQIPELTREQISVSWGLSKQTLGLRASNMGGTLYREGELGLIYGREVSQKLSIGLEVSGRFLSLDKYSSSNTVTFSAGIIANPISSVTVGAVWKNLNEPTLKPCRDKIRELLVLGGAVEISATTRICADLVQEKFFNAEYRVGVEARLLPKLILRVGASAEPVRPAAGFQIDMGRWSFLYAGNLHQELGPSHEIGLMVRLRP